MKKILWPTLAVLGIFTLAGTASAATLSGKVTSVDAQGNSLMLATERTASTEPAEYKLVWDDNIADGQKLENARVGEILTVDAEQNAVTRNWNVQRIGGALADAENAVLRTDDQIINGKIRSIDASTNAMVLVSENVGTPGETEFRVVWDDSDVEVRDRLEKSAVGDTITLTADQNKATRNWKAKSVAGSVKAFVEGDVQTLVGQVKAVDPERNYIVLTTTDETGKQVERKIVWDNDFKQQAKLEGARIGQRLSVRADQNMVTRNWKVKAISG